MTILANYVRDWYRGVLAGWDRFWFTAVDPATVSLMRVLAGGMLLYTHLVWTVGLDDFFGDSAWVSSRAVSTYEPTGYAWSYFWFIHSRTLLYAVHFAALVVFALFTIGLFSRVTAVLAYVITVAYVNRVPGSLFGLDQINALLAMYLMLGPCGARYSVDHWLARRRAGGAALAVAPSVGANVSMRLIQLHMCVIYFFAGITKLQGPVWWDGSAFWGAVANLEYQSLELTWLAGWPMLIAFMTHATIVWEVTYAALVWPRFTRPLVLAMAIPLHLGICLGLGMMTFGLVMLIANLAFVAPWLVRAVLEPRAVALEKGAESVQREQAAPPPRTRKPRGERVSTTN